MVVTPSHINVTCVERVTNPALYIASMQQRLRLGSAESDQDRSVLLLLQQTVGWLFLTDTPQQWVHVRLQKGLFEVPT